MLGKNVGNKKRVFKNSKKKRTVWTKREIENIQKLFSMIGGMPCDSSLEL